MGIQQSVYGAATDGIHNPAPIIDLMIVTNQIKNNTDLFKLVTPISSPKKLVKQVTPNNSTLPALGLTIDYCSASENDLNEVVAQVMTISVCFTVVLDTTNDLTGAGTQFVMFDQAYRALSWSVYNYQPDTPGIKSRYLNGFTFDKSERIENLCDDAYEVYCIYYEIQAQIDYLDGYLTPEQHLLEINLKAATSPLYQIEQNIVTQ